MSYSNANCTLWTFYASHSHKCLMIIHQLYDIIIWSKTKMPSLVWKTKTVVLSHAHYKVTPLATGNHLELVTKVSQLQDHYIKFNDWWLKWQFWLEFAKETLYKPFDIGHVDHALDEELQETLANRFVSYCYFGWFQYTWSSQWRDF